MNILTPLALPAGSDDGLAGGDFDGFAGPSGDDVNAEGAVGLEEVPAAVAVLFIHAGEDAAGDVVAPDFDPGAITEFLIFFEIACLA
jgi:hypothetical protein